MSSPGIFTTDEKAKEITKQQRREPLFALLSRRATDIVSPHVFPLKSIIQSNSTISFIPVKNIVNQVQLTRFYSLMKTENEEQLKNLESPKKI